MPEEAGTAAEKSMATAMSELAACENLLQLSSWAARWASRASGAETVLVWTPDPNHPLLVCTGGSGDGSRSALRTSVGRDDALTREVLRDRTPLLFSREEFQSRGKGWLPDLPAGGEWILLIPAEAEADGAPAAVFALLFSARPHAEKVAEGLQGLVRHAAKALAHGVKAERKTAGMRQAIERLTALYDLSKAFGSTLEWSELNRIIVRKAVDFAGAEAGSLWLLDSEADSVELAATAINENYEVANPPAAVGGDLVGDVLASGEALRRNRIPADEISGAADPEFPIRSVLAVVLVEQEAPLGGLVLVNKRGRVPDFSEEDQELLEDLARQAVRALRNARQFEAEKKVEELDALLAVSREITATLDLDKVMQTIVNATAALVAYDRCAIAILDRGKLRLGAVSGTAELDRKSPDIRRTEDLLQWVFFAGENVNVREEPDGTVAADRPETQEKFRAFFAESGRKAFYGVLLEDEEGKLGVLAFECAEPLVFDAETRDLLQILVNQATVAVRNAQLYRQVPLAGFWRGLVARRQRLGQLPRSRRLGWAIAAGILLVLLFLPWRFRITGPARILPGRRGVVTAGVDGIVRKVFHREGDHVTQGEVLATLQDEAYEAGRADARSAFEIANGEVNRRRSLGEASAVFDAVSRRDEALARLTLSDAQLARTKLVAPSSGTILTPRLEDRVGQNIARGGEFCVIGDDATLTAEIAIPEEDVTMIQPNQTVDVKLHPFPSRTFRARIVRVGARIREEDKSRFVIAEAMVEGGQGLLKTGMLGTAKVRVGHRSIGTLFFRKPARYLYSKIWPLLP